MVTEVFVNVSFDAAHSLPYVPPDHKCRAVHGHTYRVTLRVRGPVGADGFVVDYQRILDAWAPLHAQLDHRYLNDVHGLSNPTCENIGAWILRAIPTLTSVVVYETMTAGCEVWREGMMPFAPACWG